MTAKHPAGDPITFERPSKRRETKNEEDHFPRSRSHTVWALSPGAASGPPTHRRTAQLEGAAAAREPDGKVW
jgi:hypothetical protein